MSFPSVPEHGVGEQMLTFRMASNAIWNKLNFALSLVGQPQHQKQMADLMKEARELADSIVHQEDSGR